MKRTYYGILTTLRYLNLSAIPQDRLDHLHVLGEKTEPQKKLRGPSTVLRPGQPYPGPAGTRPPPATYGGGFEGT